MSGPTLASARSSPLAKSSRPCLHSRGSQHFCSQQYSDTPSFTVSVGVPGRSTSTDGKTLLHPACEVTMGLSEVETSRDLRCTALNSTTTRLRTIRNGTSRTPRKSTMTPEADSRVQIVLGIEIVSPWMRMITGYEREKFFRSMYAICMPG
jgi:hypothetical protein